MNSTASAPPGMSALPAGALLLGLSLLLTGCQCCALTDHWSDFVDCTSDHEGDLDRWYCSRCDLNRINRPCGPWRCGGCPPAVCPQPVYAHRWGPRTEPLRIPDDGDAPIPSLPEDDGSSYFPETDPLLEPELDLDGEPPAAELRSPVRLERIEVDGPVLRSAGSAKPPQE